VTLQRTFYFTLLRSGTTRVRAPSRSRSSSSWPSADGRYVLALPSRGAVRQRRSGFPWGT